MNPELVKILKPAFAPCIGFSSTCKEMVWKPLCGFMPRGYYGALGEIEEVRVVFVFAEPGNPFGDEEYSDFESGFNYVGKQFRESIDPFHKNIRNILSTCWPDLSLEDQFHRVWMTESVLCSAKRETGSIPIEICDLCGKTYLSKQLMIFQKSLIVAMGGKAEHRLKRLGFEDFLRVSSPAMPEGNKQRAKESWQKIVQEIRKREDGLPE
jgi:hypothetical protein